METIKKLAESRKDGCCLRLLVRVSVSLIQICAILKCKRFKRCDPCLTASSGCEGIGHRDASRMYYNKHAVIYTWDESIERKSRPNVLKKLNVFGCAYEWFIAILRIMFKTTLLYSKKIQKTWLCGSLTKMLFIEMLLHPKNHWIKICWPLFGDNWYIFVVDALKVFIALEWLTLRFR